MASQRFTRITDAPAGTHYKGLSLAPFNPLVSQPVPTPPPSTTVTPTPSASPLGATNAFQTTSLMVVRTSMAGVTNAAQGVALPTFVDEIDVTTGAVIQSIALPTVATVGSNPCTLTHGWSGLPFQYGDQEGQPQRSADGRVIVFPCYANATGTVLNGTGTKTVAFLRADGSVDTSTAVNGLFQPSTDINRPLTLRTAASATGATALITGTSSVGASLWVATQGTGSQVALQVRSAPDIAVVPFTTDPRYVTIFDGVAYVSNGVLANTNAAFYGISALLVNGVPGIPSGSWSENATTLRLAGTQNTVGATNNTSPFAFVFNGPNELWVAEARTFNLFQLVKYTTAVNVASPWLGAWSPVASVFIDNSRQLQALTGRVEGGEFVLYATQSHRITRYATVSGTQTIVATAPAGSAFHGAALPPFNPALAAAAPPTSRPTPSPSPAVPSLTTATSAFQANSLIVVRVGEGYSYGGGRAMPAFFLEMDPNTGDVLQEIPLPQTDGPNGYACTILQPSSGTSEGFGSLSANGRLIVLPCTSKAVNSTTTNGVALPRAIAILKADGTIDTTQRVPDAYAFGWVSSAPTYFRSVFTVDGASVYPANPMAAKRWGSKWRIAQNQRTRMCSLIHLPLSYVPLFNLTASHCSQEAPSGWRAALPPPTRQCTMPTLAFATCATGMRAPSS